MLTIYDGLTIGDKHTYNDFGLILKSFYIPEPDAKVNKIDVPFASGSIDLTEISGSVPYNDRKGLTFEFEAKKRTREQFASLIQGLSMYLHGKAMRVICDWDIGYYYMARLEVDAKKTNPSTCTVSLKGDAEPFKYSIQASHEPWLWDPFNFNDGIIISTADIVIDGSASVTIPAGGLPCSVEFIVTQANADLEVHFGTKVFSIPNTGTYRFPQVKAGGDEDTEIDFAGHGKVSIAYRSRYL